MKIKKKKQMQFFHKMYQRIARLTCSLLLLLLWTRHARIFSLDIHFYNSFCVYTAKQFCLDNFVCACVCAVRTRLFRYSIFL